jgi:hypothetical protein
VAVPQLWTPEGVNVTARPDFTDLATFVEVLESFGEAQTAGAARETLHRAEAV